MKKYGFTNFHDKIATIDDLGSIVLHVKKLPDPSLVQTGAIARLIDSQPGYASGNYYIRTVDGEWKILPGDIEYDVTLANAVITSSIKSGLVMDEVTVTVNFSLVPNAQWSGTDYIAVNYLKGDQPPKHPDDGVVLCKIPGYLSNSNKYTLTGFITHPCQEYSLAVFGMFANGSWFKIPAPALV